MTSLISKIWSFFKRKKLKFELSRKGRVDSPVVLFVHGLSGSTEGTWSSLLSVFGSDPDLSMCAFHCYEYPTSLFRLPFQRRMPGIREIADGLRTFIETNCLEQTSILLVGHSLGGVVVRQYLLEAVKDKRFSSVKGIVLYASPNTGASLADVGKLISWKHRHLRQLGRESDLLDALNGDWIRLKVEELIPTLYVVGGKDSVVPRNSSNWIPGSQNVATSIGDDHLSIIKPIDSDATSFKVLKVFVRKQFGLNVSQNIEYTPQEGDPLFDVYSITHEKFYIQRGFDNTLALSTRAAHAWVHGKSGVGKTAALRRLIDQNKWQLQQVSLGGCQGLSPINLLEEVCSELSDRACLPAISGADDNDFPSLLTKFRRVLRVLSTNSPVSIFIEEIPLPAGKAFGDFLELVSHLAVSAEVDSMPNRVVWLFSSINDPSHELPPESVKFLERVQILECPVWERGDIEKLVELILSKTGMRLTPVDFTLLSQSANGNPRFIKVLLRRMRNHNGRQMEMSDLIAAVRRDLNGHV